MQLFSSELYMVCVSGNSGTQWAVSLHFPSVSVPESQLFSIVIKPAERNNVYLDRSGGRPSPRDTILWLQRRLFSGPSNMWNQREKEFPTCALGKTV